MSVEEVSRATRIPVSSIERIEAFRLAHPEHEIIDVQYADLVGDPLRTIETVYGARGRTLDDSARAAISASVAANPKGRFGTHGYRLDEFGLRADAIRDRFSDYIERYDVPAEVSNA